MSDDSPFHGLFPDPEERNHSGPDSERLLRALRVAVPVEAPGKVDARRSALIRIISQEIAQAPARVARQERQRRWTRWGAALSAAAVVALSGAWALQHQETLGGPGPAQVADLSAAQLISDRSQVSLSLPQSSPAHLGEVAEGRARVVLHSANEENHQELATGQELTLSGDSWITAELPGSTQIELRNKAQSGAAHMRLTHLGRTEQSLFVRSGRLSVDVPEGRPDRRHVMVVTPDAQVEVKGTKFQVDVVEQNGESTTGVSVQRGKVLVTWLGGSRLLTPGQSWTSSHGPETEGEPPSLRDPAKADSARTDSTSTTRPTSVRVVRSADAPPASARKSTPAPSSDSSEAAQRDARLSSSTLGEQNRLLERALGAQRRGQSHQALELFNELLQRYPESPLRSTAIAERRRLLSEIE